MSEGDGGYGKSGMDGRGEMRTEKEERRRRRNWNQDVLLDTFKIWRLRGTGGEMRRRLDKGASDAKTVKEGEGEAKRLGEQAADRHPFLSDDGSEAPAVKAPVQAKKAEAPKAAREVPGSKAPQQASRGRGGYYSRGAPRNVLKTNSDKTADVDAQDPESGFEGERRGTLEEMAGRSGI
jgi:hypothetical protein